MGSFWTEWGLRLLRLSRSYINLHPRLGRLIGFPGFVSAKYLAQIQKMPVVTAGALLRVRGNVSLYPEVTFSHLLTSIGHRIPSQVGNGLPVN